MEGLGGNDTLLGNDGNDDVNGYSGNDTLRGGAGDDEFHGDYSDTYNEGSDTIRGGGGYDYVYDLIGENKIYGQGGSDEIYGYGLLNGGKGNDYIRAYNDLSGEGQTETIIGGLAVVLEGTPRGVLVMRDELAGWVRSMDQYKSGGKGADRQFWLSGWSNSHVIVDRKGRGEPLFLPRPFVGVVGAIQPGVLPELGAGREDGMMDRFLFAYPLPVPSAWSDHEISPASRAEYARLYERLRELHMNTDEHGDPNPVRVHFSPDAKELFKGAVNELGKERHRPGFPARLKGPYSKLEAYLARLSLILALSRAADTGVAERVEEDDVLAAMVLVDYFKGMARRVYRENPRERFAEDVAKFLDGRGGHFKDEPHVLHEQLESRYKPSRPDELTKKLKDIITRTPGLTLNTGNFPKEGQSRRCVELSLENGVNGVNGVNPATGDKLDMPGEKHFGLNGKGVPR